MAWFDLPSQAIPTTIVHYLFSFSLALAHALNVVLSCIATLILSLLLFSACCIEQLLVLSFDAVITLAPRNVFVFDCICTNCIAGPFWLYWPFLATLLPCTPRLPHYATPGNGYLAK
jgi:hypothetical protein